MGKNKVKVTGFRIEDESILEKLQIIADNNLRTRNKEVEFALKKYVQEYESKYGEIVTKKDNQAKEITITTGTATTSIRLRKAEGPLPAATPIIIDLSDKNKKPTS